MKKLYLLLVSLICAIAVAAQPTIEIDNVDGDPGGVISVNFKVKDFTDIIGMQFSINWDPAVLAFNSISNFTDSIRDFDAASFNVDPKFTDDFLEEVLEKNSDIFRPARLKGRKIGLAKL